MKSTTLKQTQPKEIWVETTTSNKQMIHWLADTGFPRSFLTLEKANEIIKNNPKLRLQPYNSQTQYRNFNNNNIKVEGTLQLTLQWGTWTAKNSQVLVAEHNTNNLIGRDILQKIGILLQQRSKQSPGNHFNSNSYIETKKNIIKWILKKSTLMYASRQIKKPNRQINVQTEPYS